ncbi:MAG: NAD(P)(+) transhydrogenase (Re/Si-specific) subunit beta [Sedimentisphaerales bacterium]|nr:NAD(P)(+) transhydrogenase (Re/Si-specific) subunit beta [Sedimentisphaerales bacterium]
MTVTLYRLIDLACVVAIVSGIRLMNSPKTARAGNLLGAAFMLVAIITTMIINGIVSLGVLWISMVLGVVIGCLLSVCVTMTQIPQLVALFNGFGGAASAIIAFVVLTSNTADSSGITRFTGTLALVVGGVTFSGSLVAVAKLAARITQLPIILRGHFIFNLLALIVTIILIPLVTVASSNTVTMLSVLLIGISLIFGVLFAIRIGGADMPITISLLNSLSGIAAATLGLATSNLLLVAVGAIVGSAGIILTQIMCRAMNSSVFDILTGTTVLSKTSQTALGSLYKDSWPETPQSTSAAKDATTCIDESAAIIGAAQKIIIVPGYGMALAQAQFHLKQLLAILEAKGKQVKFAIHPVAGRMPGHMNVLLAEAEIPYDKLYPMEDINPEFKETDVALVVGANDVVNPAARTAEGTPIYGMPVLNVDEAGYVIICNKDTRPGYAGLNNTLYLPRKNTILLLGDAAESLSNLLEKLL